jgi:hypothetical protein
MQLELPDETFEQGRNVSWFARLILMSYKYTKNCAIRKRPTPTFDPEAFDANSEFKFSIGCMFDNTISLVIHVNIKVSRLISKSPLQAKRLSFSFIYIVTHFIFVSSFCSHAISTYCFIFCCSEQCCCSA